MQIYRLTVEPDGRVTVPNARPGQMVTVQVEAVTEAEPMTLAAAKTPEEREVVIADILEMAGQLRELLKLDLPIGTDELYGEDGLPA
jgi:NAD(P)H-flavin reductase